MADPTPAVDPAEIEAGMAAATVCGCSAGRKREVVTQVLAAVLPDHDARVRRATLQWAAREVRDRLCDSPPAAGQPVRRPDRPHHRGGREASEYRQRTPTYAGPSAGCVAMMIGDSLRLGCREAEIRADERARVAEEIAQAMAQENHTLVAATGSTPTAGRVPVLPHHVGCNPVGARRPADTATDEGGGMRGSDYSEEQREALRRHGYDPDLPPRGVAGPPGVIQFWDGPAMRNHVCELDGIEIDGHEGSDLDPTSTACIHCDYEGPNP